MKTKIHKQYFVARWKINSDFEYRILDKSIKNEREIIKDLLYFNISEYDVGFKSNDKEEAIKKCDKLNKLRNLLKE